MTIRNILLTATLVFSSGVAFNSDAQGLDINFSSGSFPAGVTAANESGITPVANYYDHGWTADGWMVDRVGNLGYCAVAPTCTNKTAPILSRLSLPSTEISEGMWMRWHARSLHPHLLESYRVEFKENGASEPVVLAEIKNENYGWNTRLLSLNEIAGKKGALSLVVTSANRFLLAVDEIKVWAPDAPEYDIENDAMQYTDLKGQTIRGKVRNVCGVGNPVAITCHINGEEVGRVNVNGSWGTDEIREYEFALPGTENVRTEYTVSIENADGSEILLLTDSFYSSAFPRRLFVDKATGMWCTLCPKGILMMEELEEKYGSQLVAVETHQGDPLECTGYWSHLNFHGVPYFMLNRISASAKSDLTNFDNYWDKPVTFATDIDTTKVHDDHAQVTVNVKSAENIDNAADRYRIGYVITQDIHADINPAYYQDCSLTRPQYDRFYFLSEKIPAYLTWFEKVSLTYDEAFNGLENSLPDALKAGEAYSYKWTVEIPENLENMKLGRLAVFVLDTETGEIMNADAAYLDKNIDKPVEPTEPTEPDTPVSSIAFSENFNAEYTENFPTLLELDHLEPLSNFRTLFMDGDGVSRPWWRLKDSSASKEAFIGSHSAYTTPGTSNDWIVSRPVQIPTEGFVLSFGAQSYVMRSGDRLSDLWVYVTETPPAEGALPDTPILHIEKVGEGKDKNNIESDFIPYEINLDAFAGKTVYISFANLNTDKDILCIDDVVVGRRDNVYVTASAPEYVEKGQFSVEVSAGAVDKDYKGPWTLTFDPGTGATPTVQKGENLSVAGFAPTFTADIDVDQVADWTVTLVAGEEDPVIAKGKTTGLAFIPWHNVLIEESTGMWCGNCPLGMYALENMILHPEMKDYVIPVSIHILQSSERDDYMYNENYAYMSGLRVAPAMRIDRGRQVVTFDIGHDGKPIDFTDDKSVASRVREAHETVTLMDVSVSGTYFYEGEGEKPSHIFAEVKVRPAVTLPGKNYRLGFILVENNVSFPGNPFWVQENYFSGYQLNSGLGGFTSLPDKISGWKYMDVARGVFDFHGLDAVKFPETMKAGEEYLLTASIEVPDVSVKTEQSTFAKDLNPDNLSLIAFVLDEPSGYYAVNSAIYPMTEQAEIRPTIAEQAEALKQSGIDTIIGGNENVSAQYFTLQGVKVSNPVPGIYIVRRGDKVTKEIVK